MLSINSSYQLIYADPPWYFRARSERGESRSAKKHYPVMSRDEIASLPVSKIAAKNSVLLMWAIDPMLNVAFEVIKAWGFTFKTVGFYWVKQNVKSDSFFTGLGYYTRANPEQCLLATRGAGLKRKDRSVQRLIISPRGRHSEKPAEAYRRIELLFGNVTRIELFARRRRAGWKAFGNQVERYHRGGFYSVGSSLTSRSRTRYVSSRSNTARLPSVAIRQGPPKKSSATMPTLRPATSTAAPTTTRV
jgi:N6-adenosine-specific RNA methylase IME4